MSTTISFKASCIKTLSPVEVDLKRSHQHEFNGVKELKDLLGTQGSKCNATFSIRGEDILSEALVTWYDARTAHPSRSEYRLYFYPNEVMGKATAGDNIITGFDMKNHLQIVLIKNGSVSHQGQIDNWEAT